MEQTAVLDNKTIVFVLWVNEILACVSNGEKEIFVTKSRLTFK
jgi:hypothetical protein